MDTIAFVVLHYSVPEVTRQCVDSIRELQGNKKKKIVIVDNASPDGSGILLEKEYAQGVSAGIYKATNLLIKRKRKVSILTVVHR